MAGHNNTIIPFLKWAGGKRWLVNSEKLQIPIEYNRYIEPFLGSGAVFFHLKPKRAILADINKELIETYEVVRDDHEALIQLLEKHQKKHSEKYYYKIRSLIPKDKTVRAARFIYLNRTCWNGLYRVNKKGEFNVPKGTKDKVLLDTDDFVSISKKLSNVQLLYDDFEKTIDMAQKGDFLFIDPPYTVNHKFNGFLKYNEKIFTWKDQIRLSKAVKNAKLRGSKIILTNADHESIFQLYENDFNIKQINRASVLSGKSKYRGSVTELLITEI